MTRTGSTPASAKSRRRFLKVAAMGSAAALVTAALPGAGAAAPARRGVRPKPVEPPAPHPSALEAEVAKQKKSTADLVKTIREFELPPGSEMAFAFVPAKAGKRRATRGGAGGAR